MHRHWVTEQSARHLLGYTTTELLMLPRSADGLDLVGVPCDGGPGCPTR